MLAYLPNHAKRSPQEHLQIRRFLQVIVEVLLASSLVLRRSELDMP